MTAGRQSLLQEKIHGRLRVIVTFGFVREQSLSLRKEPVYDLICVTSCRLLERAVSVAESRRSRQRHSSGLGSCMLRNPRRLVANGAYFRVKEHHAEQKRSQSTSNQPR